MPESTPAVDFEYREEARVKEAWSLLYNFARRVHSLTDETRKAIHSLRSSDVYASLDAQADDTAFVSPNRKIGAGSGHPTPTVGEMKDVIKAVCMLSDMLNAADHRIPEILDPTVLADLTTDDLHGFLDKVGR